MCSRTLTPIVPSPISVIIPFKSPSRTEVPPIPGSIAEIDCLIPYPT